MFKKYDYDKCVLIMERNDKYSSTIIDEELVNTLFFRLFFTEGKGLSHFEPFYQDDDNMIYIYRVIW